MGLYSVPLFFLWRRSDSKKSNITTITTTPPTAPPTIAPVGNPLCAWSVELGELYPTGMVVVVPMVVAVLVLGMVEMLEPLRQERSAVQTHSVRITKKMGTQRLTACLNCES